jgi:hypothetical protein
MNDVSNLRHNAFSAKLAVHRVATFYNEFKRSDLAHRIPETQNTLSGHQLRNLFEEFQDLSRRMQSALFDEMTRLSLEAEYAVHSYAKARYGFGPGEEIDVTLPGPVGEAKVRIVKVFLQSGTESDIRVDASQLGADGNPEARWDIFMKGPGQVQPDKSIKRELGARWQDR